jgi:hypothetical protein
MAHIHGIRNITLGAIATTSILVMLPTIFTLGICVDFIFQARWALSCDETLQPVGANTGIHYFDDYGEYLKILETGLRRKKKSVLNIIKQWDSQIFPNTDSSLIGARAKSSTEDGGVKRAMDALDADSEEEEDELEA